MNITMKISRMVIFLSSIISLGFSEEKPKILDYICKNLNCSEGVSGFNAIDQIYVVNLDIRYEKWLDIQKKFEMLGMYPKRVSGINGWAVDPKKMKFFYKNCIQQPYAKTFTRGQIGCFLSHLSILMDAFQKQYKNIWVLEDDVLIVGNLRELDTIVSDISELDPEWDLVFTDENVKGKTLGEIWSFETVLGNKFNYSLVTDPKFIPIENEKFKKIEHRLGTYSVIISNKGIKKLLEYFQSIKISFPIDVQMHCCPDKHFYVTKKDYVTNNGKSEISDTVLKPNL